MKSREERNAILERAYLTGIASIRDEKTGEFLTGQPAVKYFRFANRTAVREFRALVRENRREEKMKESVRIRLVQGLLAKRVGLQSERRALVEQYNADCARLRGMKGGTQRIYLDCDIDDDLLVIRGLEAEIDSIDERLDALQSE